MADMGISWPGPQMHERASQESSWRLLVAHVPGYCPGNFILSHINIHPSTKTYLIMMYGHPIVPTAVFILGFQSWISCKILHNIVISTDRFDMMTDKPSSSPATSFWDLWMTSLASLSNRAEDGISALFVREINMFWCLVMRASPDFH